MATPKQNEPRKENKPCNQYQIHYDQPNKTSCNTIFSTLPTRSINQIRDMHNTMA